MYSPFARHFDETRYKPWPAVVAFLNALPSHTTVLDLGCGNGKYLYRRDLDWSACDPCPELAAIAAAKYPVDVLVADGCALPYPTHSMDVVISIAVFHHIETEDRQAFLKEVRRVLRPGGTFFLSVWIPTPRPSWKIHRNLYEIPWHDKYSHTTHWRRYHIFQPTELPTVLSPFIIQELREECENLYVLCQ